MTPFHSKYWAAALTLRGPSGSLAALSRSLSNARVDLNPHQVDAALFAIRSPLNRGVLLADEVGLGKTVEAGIVITQRWAERRRKILLILPATLRKQWQSELTEKFSLPSVILEGNKVQVDPPGAVAICSYHFAAARAAAIREIPWDLVVIDEAQNCTYGQIKMLLTRLGWHSTMVITGDPDQSDLLPGISGLADIASKLETLADIAVVRLSKQDVVRHPLVACMLAAL